MIGCGTRYVGRLAFQKMEELSPSRTAGEHCELTSALKFQRRNTTR